jgi:hypothetical protein
MDLVQRAQLTLDWGSDQCPSLYATQDEDRLHQSRTGYSHSRNRGVEHKACFKNSSEDHCVVNSIMAELVHFGPTTQVKALRYTILHCVLKLL